LIITFNIEKPHTNEIEIRRHEIHILTLNLSFNSQNLTQNIMAFVYTTCPLRSFVPSLLSFINFGLIIGRYV